MKIAKVSQCILVLGIRAAACSGLACAASAALPVAPASVIFHSSLPNWPMLADSDLPLISGSSTLPRSTEIISVDPGMIDGSAHFPVRRSVWRLSGESLDAIAPEPGYYAVLLIGLAGLAVAVRRSA